MRRHKSIIPLSRDHHIALLCCWKIREGVRKNVTQSRILSYIQYFWNHHLKEHFEQEERILFVTVEDELIYRAVKEHETLKECIGSLRLDSSFTSFLQFAHLLDDHIRFEERILFPHLEQTLSEDQLYMVEKRLQDIHPINKTDNYNDEFWL